MEIDGARLRAERQRQQLSQRQLANAARTTVETVARLEYGPQIVRVSTVRKLARALGVTPEHLARRDDGKNGEAASDPEF